jgi:hypothetical protein
MANFLQTTALICSLFPQYCPSGSLPVVDLGYVRRPLAAAILPICPNRRADVLRRKNTKRLSGTN